MADDGADASAPSETRADVEEGRLEASSAPPPLSKNAQKRLLKRERALVMRAKRREEERAVKKAKAERVKAEFHARLDGMSEEERKEYLRARSERLAAHAEAHRRKKEARGKQLESKYALLVDCEFADVMSRDKEWVSLIHQLKFVYERNCKSTTPFRLTFTGIGGDFATELRRIVMGFDNWHVIRREGTIEEAMEEDSTLRESLVYLTADSENELTTVEEGKTYVIGGFIDRNRLKGLTLSKAKKLGVAHARLPISEHLKLRGTSVLTVNQTSDVLSSFLERGDWGEAMEAVVPLRKVHQNVPTNDDENDRVDEEEEEEEEEEDA